MNAFALEAGVHTYISPQLREPTRGTLLRQMYRKAISTQFATIGIANSRRCATLDYEFSGGDSILWIPTKLGRNLSR